MKYPFNRFNNLQSLLLLIIWVLVLLSVFYFSWVPSPRLSESGLLPEWLAKWADINFNVRTGVPFVLLGILGGQLNKTAFTLKLVTSWGIAFLVIGLAAETGQLLLPSRHFDWADVFWGVAGGFVGLGISLSFTMLWNQRDNKSKENQPNRQSSS